MSFKHAFLYGLTVLIWGSTWIAIELQLGKVAPEVSLVYRFSLAALLMWAFCLWKQLPMRFSWVNHGFFILLAFCNFGVNYYITYWAQTSLSSAMAATASSTILAMNILNYRLIFRQSIAIKSYVGMVFGTLGMIAFFWRDIRALDLSNEIMIGLILMLLSNLIVSLGNMISLRNSKKRVGVFQANAWGMLYGSLGLALTAVLNGSAFTFETSVSYVGSLLFLSIFGTVVAFACYYILLADIGPEKASYISVLYPIIAVILGSLFDGFTWSASTALGFMMILLGNMVMITPRRYYRWRLSTPLKNQPLNE